MVKAYRVSIFIVMFILANVFSEANAIKVGDKAPEFSLSNINGEMVSLSDYKDNIVMLIFFASWCPSCKKETPDLIELQETYGDKGFSVIGIAGVSAEEAKNFAEELDINYSVLVDDDDKVSDQYGPVESIPAMFLLDKNGNIVKTYVGLTEKDEIDSDIQDLLKP